MGCESACESYGQSADVYEWEFNPVEVKSNATDRVVRGLWAGAVGGVEVLCAACNGYLWQLSLADDGTWSKTACGTVDGILRMKRLGKNSGQSYGTELEFRKGGRFSSRYQTPFGSFDMEVLTNSLETSIDEDGCGLIKVDYHVSLEGMSEGRNALEIEISQ